MNLLNNSLRDLNVTSTIVRLLVAALCGGAIGLERTYHRRPAGFRTHILICVGACVTTMTSQFLVLYMHYYTDMARLGAQVIAGIGFIGAGTIIVTQQQRIKGLTTAAGLWTDAIVGLAIGAGFYEGGVLVTVLILISELVFSRLEHRLLDRTPEINLYLEYVSKAALRNVFNLCRDEDVKIQNIEITRSSATKKHNATALLSLRLKRHMSVKEFKEKVNAVDGIVIIEEL